MVIEHDADTITQSDWVIELGPGPGDEGGEIVFQGPPEGLFRAKTPWGKALSERAAMHGDLATARAA